MRYPHLAAANFPAQSSTFRFAAWAIVGRFLIALTIFGVGALGYRYAFHQSGRPPLWATGAATVMVAVFLWLLRQRIEQWAHRRVLGEHAQGYQGIRALLQRMGATLPVDEVIPHLAETLARSARSSRAEVRLNLEGGAQWTEVWPVSTVPRAQSLSLQIQHLGDHVGDVELDATDAAGATRDRRLLDDLAGPAGLALSTVRLTFALRERRAALASLYDMLLFSQRRLSRRQIR